jgi:hypothetical protein
MLFSEKQYKLDVCLFSMQHGALRAAIVGKACSSTMRHGAAPVRQPLPCILFISFPAQSGPVNFISLMICAESKCTWIDVLIF